MALVVGALPSQALRLPQGRSRKERRAPPHSAKTSSGSHGGARCRAASSESAGGALPAAMDPAQLQLWQYTPEAEGPLERPAWSGEDPISKVVNTLISIKPLFGLMKLGARQVLINTAEKAGVPWRERAAELKATEEVYTLKERLENKDLAYPSYYLNEFHAYREGNLCWEAAFEVESATQSMCRRAIPWAQSAEEAAKILRGGWLSAIHQHIERQAGPRQGPLVKDILDVGCSVGISTGFLAEAYPEASITGVDLSPHFLAVAAHREETMESRGLRRGKKVRWLHAAGEATGLPDSSFDLVSLAYVVHECPEEATRALLREAHRVLRPGGTLAVTDNSAISHCGWLSGCSDWRTDVLQPKSKVIQSLPAPIFTLMKATEPWSDEYYQMDLEQAARNAGFQSVSSKLSDPRHRTLTATAS